MVQWGIMRDEWESAMSDWVVDDAMVEEREKRSSECDPTILKHTAVSVQCPFI